MKLIIRKNRYTKGDIMRIIREWTGLTQKQFAQDIGKSEGSVQKYEADEVGVLKMKHDPRAEIPCGSGG